MADTLLTNLIVPEVMGDMISAELENKLQATGFYKVDNTLTGKPGNTITIPTFAYIGEAEDLEENTAGTPAQLTASESEYTIKKVSKFVRLTDEALLSGYGDPMGEATKQLRMSIQDKADTDGITLLESITTAGGGLVYEAEAISTANIYSTLIEAQDLFNDEEMGKDYYLLLGRDVAKTIRTSAEFKDRNTGLGDKVLSSGAVGTIAGCQLVISNKISPNTAFILTKGAMTVFMKRAVQVEKERESLYKRTLVSADQHFVVAIEDYSKIVKINFATA